MGELRGNCEKADFLDSHPKIQAAPKQAKKPTCPPHPWAHPATLQHSRKHLPRNYSVLLPTGHGRKPGHKCAQDFSGRSERENRLTDAAAQLCRERRLDFVTGLGEPGSPALAPAGAPPVGCGFAKGMAGSASNHSFLLSLGHTPPHKTL